MRKLACTLFAMVVLTMTSYAGQWQQDSGGYRYQNDDGTYMTGWYQDVDEKWYYFDEETAYMLSGTTTPDGYSVSLDGVWQEGNTTMIINNSTFDNVVELKVTAYEYGPNRIKQLESELPVTIYYNNTYKNIYSGNIDVSTIGVSKDGMAYINFSVDENDIYKLAAKTKYTYEDGSYVERMERIFASATRGERDFSYPLETVREIRKGPKLISTEIWIEEAEELI